MQNDYPTTLIVRLKGRQHTLHTMCPTRKEERCLSKEDYDYRCTASYASIYVFPNRLKIVVEYVEKMEKMRVKLAEPCTVHFGKSENDISKDPQLREVYAEAKRELESEVTR